MTFEESLNKLNQIVEQLEKGEISLAQSLELYDEAKKLSEECKKQLEDAKLQVRIIDNNKRN